MKTRSSIIATLLLCLYFTGWFQCASNDGIVGGSGAETGNARVFGTVIDAAGAPVEGAVASCYPASYNPVTDTPPGVPFIDTTDADGTYSFTLTDKTTFNIFIKNPGVDYAALLTQVNSENDTLATVTLKKAGSITVTFSPEAGMKTGTLFLGGTPMYAPVGQRDIAAGFIRIDSIAEGCYSSINFSGDAAGYHAVLGKEICVKSNDTTEVPVCLCSETGYGYDNRPLTPVRSQYSSSSGRISRNVWTGSKVALQTKDSTLDPCVIRRIISVLDSAVAFNSKFIGQSPPLDKQYQGLLSVAEIPAMNGLYSGSIGVTGVEMGEEQFQKLYQSVAEENIFPQELFFVLSNNFNFFINRLSSGSNAKYSIAVLRGFSVFMRFVTMEGIGIKAGTIMELSLSQYREKIATLMDTYLADTSLNFDNAFSVDTLPFSDLKSEHLFASMLMKLGNLYGKSFLENLWNKIEARPVAGNLQEAIDNLVLASSLSAERNLTPLFTEWKFPVSEAAKTEARELFGK